MKRGILVLASVLTLIASPALARQNLYVLNEDDDSVTVIDDFTGAVLGNFRVKSPPRDLDTGHRSDFVVVAGRNDLTWLRARNGFQRIDLQLRTPGQESTAVGVSPNDQYVYLAQTDPDAVFRIELTHPDVLENCVDPPNSDCQLSKAAEKLLPISVEDPLHMAVCDDGAVYVVGATGKLSRYDDFNVGFVPVPIPPPVPADPRGIACTPDDGVVIMSGDRVLTEVLPGPNPTVNHYPDMPVTDPGRIDVDPRRFGQSYEVLLTDRATGEILRVENGILLERIPLKSGGSGQPLPWAVAATAKGTRGTANQGADSATLLLSPSAQVLRPAGRQPIDADFGPVFGAAVEADPYSVEFVYGVGGATNTMVQEMVLKSTGTTDLYISAFLIYGSRDFSVLSENCTINFLAPQQTCVVKIGFNPSSNNPAGAPITADLRVLHNGILLPHTDFPLRAISFKQYVSEELGLEAVRGMELE